MTLLNAILMGILQGFTEFLPVSSSGHLLLGERILHLNLSSEDQLAFIVLLHGGTLLAVVLAFRKEIMTMVLRQRSTLMLLIVATLPTVIVVLSMKEIFEKWESNMQIAGIGFLITATLLLLTRWQRGEQNNMEQIGIGRSLMIGMLQVIAIAPGVSRSGCTLSAGMFCGLSRQLAVSFGFLMAIPVIAGAMAFKSKDIFNLQSSIGPVAMSAGFTAALISGLAGIWMVKWLVNSNKLYFFSFYLFPLGGLTLALHYDIIRI